MEIIKIDCGGVSVSELLGDDKPVFTSSNNAPIGVHKYDIV